MPPPIARTYSSHEAAKSAADALKARRVTVDTVHVVQPAGTHDADTPSVPQSEQASLASVLATGLAPAVAPVYAEGLRRGETLVVVHPLLGRSHQAKSILNGFGPTGTVAPEVSVEPVQSTAAARGDCCAAPFSKLLGWDVLSSDPTPLSNYLKWPVLKARVTESKTLDKIRRQSDDPAPFSKKIGMRVLSSNPTPLSGALKLATRSKTAAPFSSRFGWRVLTDDPAPFSKLLGWTVLLKPKRKPARYVRYL